VISIVDSESLVRYPGASRDGTATYGAPPAQVFQATRDALESLGLGVAVARPESGMLISKRFVLSSSATGGPGYANLTEDTLKYDISVVAAATGTQVVARPRAYRNAQEISDQDVWILDGQYGQRPRWQKLFDEIHRMRQAAAPAHAAR
jgi:hypothetical protein